MSLSYLEADISQSGMDFDFGDDYETKHSYLNSIGLNGSVQLSTTPISSLLVQVIFVIDISISSHSIKEYLNTLPADIYSLNQIQNSIHLSSQHRSIVRLQELPDSNDIELSNETTEKDIMMNNIFVPGEKAFHKLILQDSKGSLFYGIEIQRIDFISMLLPIGTKLLLKNVKFSDGMALLEPINVKYLGGRIDALDRNSRKNLYSYV
ncbi:uncharacterized protein SAPINGB_P005632 [Magnusiomyces paraingens]|uniref:RecQ-mediated genome instability protein 1 n=1 Tax=Magnusiomyces paraingens TaxID=2606893 RepID=A0A5E8C7R9_9ASCO|nr:uncharacterized protein SAPINGB_P005632 [Saprochaete ingens]VVT57276.1 unnamed protein product [Saprochaete ingens]